MKTLPEELVVLLDLDNPLELKNLEWILTRLVVRNGILPVLRTLENICEEKDQDKNSTWKEVSRIIGRAAHAIPKWWATR